MGCLLHAGAAGCDDLSVSEPLALAHSPGSGPDSFAGTMAAFRSWGLITIGALIVVAALWFWAPRLWSRWTKRDQLRRILRGDRDVNDARLLYERMLESMARRGFQKPAWFTPVEFARHLPVAEREQVDAFTTAYNEVRFGGDSEGVLRLAQILEGIENQGLKAQS